MLSAHGTEHKANGVLLQDPTGAPIRGKNGAPQVPAKPTLGREMPKEYKTKGGEISMHKVNRQLLANKMTAEIQEKSRATYPICADRAIEENQEKCRGVSPMYVDKANQERSRGVFSVRTDKANLERSRGVFSMHTDKTRSISLAPMHTDRTNQDSSRGLSPMHTNRLIGRSQGRGRIVEQPRPSERQNKNTLNCLVS